MGHIVGDRERDARLGRGGAAFIASLRFLRGVLGSMVLQMQDIRPTKAFMLARTQSTTRLQFFHRSAAQFSLREVLLESFIERPKTLNLKIWRV